MTFDWDSFEAAAYAELVRHGLDCWGIEPSRARATHGLCNHATMTISISVPLAEECGEKVVWGTLLHEIAHAIAGHAAGHGPRWKDAARMVGADPERLTSEGSTLRRREAPYRARCPQCGPRESDARKFRLGVAMRQGRYYHRACRSRLDWYENKPNGALVINGAEAYAEYVLGIG